MTELSLNIKMKELLRWDLKYCCQKWTQQIL